MASGWLCSRVCNTGSTNGRRHWHYCFSAVPYTGGAFALRFRTRPSPWTLWLALRGGGIWLMPRAPSPPGACPVLSQPG
jgi:hypothetical protein